VNRRTLLCAGAAGLTLSAMAVPAIAGNRRPPDFCPEEYGAVGDGVHDDSAAIQAALEAATLAGGTLTFKEGTTYYVRQPLRLAVDGVATLQAQAAGTATLLGPRNRRPVLEVVPGTLCDVVVDGLNVVSSLGDQESTLAGEVGLRLDGATHVTLRELTFLRYDGTISAEIEGTIEGWRE
jgi:polygalacturonase